MRGYKVLSLRFFAIILISAALIALSFNVGEDFKVSFLAEESDPAVVNLYYENDQGKIVLLPYQKARDLFIREINNRMWEKNRIVVVTQREQWLIVELSDGTCLNYSQVYLDESTVWPDVRKNPSAYKQFHVEKPEASLIIDENGNEVPLVVLVSVNAIDDITVNYGTPLETVKSKLPEKVTGIINDQEATEVSLFIEWEADASYNPEAPGDYIFEGSLSTPEALIIPSDLEKVRTKVIVRQEGDTEPEPGAISLQVRIENWEHTTVPLKQINVAPFDITHLVGDNTVGNWHKSNDDPLVIHAIIRALELEGFNVQDRNVLSVGSQGNYISKIDGLAEMDKGGLSGWKYRLNGKSVDLGVGQQTLKNGDLVEVYYRGGQSYHFGKIEASSREIPSGGTVTFTVTGQPDSVGTPPPYEPIHNAALTKNAKKTGYVTDSYGKAEITFSSPGTYQISAEKIEGNDYNLIRPVPVKVVVKDEEIRGITQNISGVSEVNEIKVEFGTSYNDIDFPEKVRVILDDGSSRSVGVNWESSAEVGYDPVTAGRYKFKGRLINLPANVTNNKGLKAEVVVTVEELKHGLPAEVDSIKVEYEPDLLRETIVHVFIKDGYDIKAVSVEDNNGNKVNAVEVENNKYYLAFFETDVTGANLIVKVDTEQAEEDPGEPEKPDFSDQIESAVSWYRSNHNPPDSWEGMPGLWGLGENLNSSPWNTNQNWRNDTYSPLTERHWHVQYIFKLLSVGKDPSSTWGGKNLFKELADLQENDGSFANYTQAAHPWPVIALDVGKELGLDVGGWNAASRKKAVNYLLAQQNSNGSFSMGLDTTGYYLIALSKYLDDPDVKSAVDDAVNYLKDMQDNEAFFDEGAGRNANSQAISISALVAVGEDPLKGAWVRNGNTPLNALLQFQQPNGQFFWKDNVAGSDNMAHDDALVALSCLLNDQSTWHMLGKEVVFID